MSKPPKKIKIGPYDYAVVILDKSEARGNYGAFVSEDQEIRLRDSFRSPHMMADTLLHEVLHGVWFVHGIVARDGEERIIGQMATGLTQVLRDNPDLVAFLRDSLK